jgi:hypothetical protein
MLVYIWEKAKRIHFNQHLDQHDKDVALARLMTAMEIHYKIPMFRDPEWEKHNQDVIIAYRAISNMRKL